MDLLGIRRLPFFARRNYYYEVKHVAFWALFAGLVEGHFGSIVISRTFGGSDFLIAIASATPFAASVVSLIWGMLSVGRPKIRLAMIFGGGAAVCIAAIGAIPNSPGGAIWFIVQMAAAQVLLSGVVTMRSAIWRSNYPVDVRGHITARLQRVRTLLSVIGVQIAAAICDGDSEAYRYIFPISAAFGVCGVLLLSRVRVRRERAELGRIRAATTPGDLREGVVERFGFVALLSPGHVLGEMSRVLKEDKRFARYCVAQFFHGIANLMTVPVVVAIVSRELQSGPRFGYWISTALLVGLPMLVLLGTLGRWGKLFDRIGVLQFRVVNLYAWCAGLLFGLLGTLVLVGDRGDSPGYYLLAVTMFVLRGLLYGVASGGGKIAWNLGHLHFAKAEQAEIYMGIHVFLTGIRGLAAPLFGMWLWTVIGWPVWGVAIGFGLVSLVLYVRMANEERKLGLSTI